MDGFDRPYWNLRQVLTWVYNGDRDLVSRTADDITDHGYFWQEATTPDGKQEMVKVPAGVPGPIHFIGTAALRGKRRAESYPAAKDEILLALMKGTLRALGLRNNKGGLIDVPCHDWAELVFAFEPPHARPRELRIGAVQWHGLQFSRDNVLAIWPDPFCTLGQQADDRQDQWEPSRRHCIDNAPRIWNTNAIPRMSETCSSLADELIKKGIKSPMNPTSTIRKWLLDAKKRGELEIPPEVQVGGRPINS